MQSCAVTVECDVIVKFKVVLITKDKILEF